LGELCVQAGKHVLDVRVTRQRTQTKHLKAIVYHTRSKWLIIIVIVIVVVIVIITEIDI
jgi:hypothetical protein